MSDPKDTKNQMGQLGHVELAKSNDIGDSRLGPIAESEYLFAKAKDSNWFFSDKIDGTRWNKSYPFQLKIVRPKVKSSPESSLAPIPNQSVDELWTFTLPIPPSDLSISTPFAISTSVTLGGIIEEHNGAPLRNISFAGTTGVYPLRGSTDVLKTDWVSEVGGILGGTLSSIQETATNFQNLKNTASSLVGKHSASTSPNLMPEDEFLATSASPKIEKTYNTSGYYQFHLLQRFLETYVNLKKKADGRDYRLVLSIWKDDAHYFVTPRSFDVRRSAGSPYEYNYNLSFVAWGRTRLAPSTSFFEGFKPIIRDPSKFRQALNVIQAGRRVVQSANGGLSAFARDVENAIFEPLRSIILFGKDVLGIGITAADLPRNIANRLKKNVAEIAADLQATGEGLAAFRASLEDYWNSRPAPKEDKSEESGGTETNKSNLDSSEPPTSNEIERIFESPSQHLEIFEKIQISKLNLSPALEGQIVQERQRVRKLDRAYFEQVRDQFVEFAADFADSIGAGNQTFNTINGRAAVPSTPREPTEEEFESLLALNSIILEMNKLAASGLIDQNQFSTVDVMAGLASRSGIAFTTPVSKFAVPFPYGMTLERLAVQYLGDANRWHEIAALNGLRQPYVDEEGFELPLLVNGNGNQVTVADSSNLLVGQSVWLSSNTASRTKRRITKIDRTSGSTAILTLDGDADLDKYKVLAKAYVHAFLPDTVNSQMTIYIPSSQPTSEDDYKTKSIPGLDEQDQYLKLGGVDLLLTQNGDLAITPDGDCKLAVGLTNIIQRLKIALETPRGSLIQHPDFGLNIRPGMSTADLDPNELKDAISTIVRDDGAFSGVQSAAILKQGPVAQIAFSVGIAGTSQFIPVSFQVKK